MKKLNILSKIFLTCFLFFTCLIPVSANDLNDPDNDGIPGINGIDYDIVREMVYADLSEYEIEGVKITPFAAIGRSIKNVKPDPYLCGGYSIPGARTSGMPGILLTIDQTWSSSASATLGVGIDIYDVEASIGFTLTDTYQIGVSGTWTVPYTYNGKTVKRADFYALGWTKIYTYDFYYLDIKTGSGSAEIPWSTSFEYVLYY